MKKTIISILIATILLSGCATILRGTHQSVHVNTNPVGAKIDFSNGQSCLSPCAITAKRDQYLIITISKEGCNTQTRKMVPSLAGALLGEIVDYGTGAVYDLRPNPLTITLSCDQKIAKTETKPVSTNEQNTKNQEVITEE